MANARAQRHVTVIGAGIVGMCAALHLQRLGFRVSVVDRLAPGEATSFGNACVITDSGVVPLATPATVKKGVKMLRDPNDPLFLRARHALKFAPWLYRFVKQARAPQVLAASTALATLLDGALREHHELADNTPAARWLGDEPTLFPYLEQADFHSDAASWQLRRERGIHFEMISAEQLRELEPALSPRYRYAVRVPSHGRAINPAKLVKAHGEWLQRGGGEVLQREVRRVDVRDSVAVNLTTDQAPLPLDIVLIAAGAWSTRLSAQLGSPVPLESEAGYHLTFTDPAITLRHTLLMPQDKLGVAAMELGVRVAGMSEFAGLDPQLKPAHGQARAELIRRKARLILPQLNTSRSTEWRGQRPTLPDSLPVIGRSPHLSNVFYAFGNQHLGLSSGPKTGKLISQLIAGQPPAVDLTPFRINRF